MRREIPKISIGMPVFNGGNYIEQAICSILEQTYSDFELIITDNASEDETEEICRDYAEKDNRVRYHRYVTNVGAAKNFNRAVYLAQGEFFKWAAHDDMLDPDYLGRCLRVLENDESLILCFPKTILVDDCGRTTGRYKVSMKNISSASPVARFRDLVLINHWGVEIFGLFRKSALDTTGLLAGFPGSDRTLMAQLGLIGRFYEIPEYLFFSRDHRKRSTRVGTIHSRAGWWDTRNTGHTVFPQWRLLVELFRCVSSAPISDAERRSCRLCLLRWIASNLNWARMLMDLAVAFEPRSWEFVNGIRKKLNGVNQKEVRDAKKDLFSEDLKP